MPIWILLMVAASAGQGVMAEDPADCDPMMMMNCLFASGVQDQRKLNFLEIPGTAEELNEQCDYTEKFMTCVNGLVDRCATPEAKKHFQELISGANGMNTELCTEGSSLRKRFLANVNCYKNHSKMFKDCALQFLENIGSVQKKAPEDQVKMTCCAFHKYRACGRDVVTGGCSKEAADLMEETMIRSLNSPMEMCTSELGVTAAKCHQNSSASHSLSTRSILILLFIVSSKAIFSNSI